jgi:hypothetical protein
MEEKEFMRNNQKNLNNLDDKIWNLLGAWQEIEPRPGYMERFKVRLAERKPWYAKLSLNVPVFKPILVICIFVMAFGSAQTYSNYTNTKAILSTMSPQEWEMLANFDTVSKLDIVKGL